MNAKKCDRCGTLYEGDGGFQRLGDLRLRRIGEYHDDDVDLCLSCKASLYAWMNYGTIRINKEEFGVE